MILTEVQVDKRSRFIFDSCRINEQTVVLEVAKKNVENISVLREI